MMGDMVTLRDVRPSDVAVFYDNQADPASAQMAGVPIRDRAAFEAHWARTGQDPANVRCTVVDGDEVVGDVVSFVMDGHRQIGYRIGRAYWNRGIASRAVQLFVTEVELRRPLFAHVLETNVGSLRVLEKAGFVEVGRQLVDGDPVPEVLLRLG